MKPVLLYLFCNYCAVSKETNDLLKVVPAAAFYLITAALIAKMAVQTYIKLM